MSPSSSGVLRFVVVAQRKRLRRQLPCNGLISQKTEAEFKFRWGIREEPVVFFVFRLSCAKNAWSFLAGRGSFKKEGFPEEKGGGLSRDTTGIFGKTPAPRNIPQGNREYP